MTRITASLAALFFLAGAAAAAPPEPASPRGYPAEYEAALRAFGKSGRWEPMGELVGHLRFEGRQAGRDLSLGSYWRGPKALKAGAFLRLQSGARHDDDWAKNPFRVWEWRDTADRTEPVLVLDATPRAALERAGLLGSLKSRFEANLFNGEKALRLEPELSWFWMEGLGPKAHFALRYEAVFALNFGAQALREQWVYLSALRHGPRGLVIGPHVALGEQVFETSRAFKDAGGSSYRARWKALRLGFDAVWRFGR
ncbi:MAG: hypothetical protein HY928_14590 [Elusimicrobia bacterium]|nr:hypothetical protein [Elusimicrobiota bacterium]